MARILCAMSGGVDSSVAALLLREAGHEVVGVFLRLGPDAAARAGGGEGSGPEAPTRRSHRGCCSVEDSRDAALVASRLGIPFYALDYEEEFTRVIDYFVEEYHRGRTPNPCARCNQWLKFGSLRARARALGCQAVATGHYARVKRDEEGARVKRDEEGARVERGREERPRLLRARDARKDQSYFLFLLGREALGEVLFPVGELEKDQVRALARRHRLPVAEKPDSQEICFVPGDYRDVLRARAPERLHPGRLVDSGGREVGEHPGHQHFTIGQRRGLGVALGEARYVVAIEPLENVVVLGSREELAARTVRVEEVIWTSRDDPPPGAVLEAEVQVRHRHRAAPARLTVEAPGQVEVRFLEPVEAPTPGQAAVFYEGPVLLGGGWIARAER